MLFLLVRIQSAGSYWSEQSLKLLLATKIKVYERLLVRKICGLLLVGVKSAGAPVGKNKAYVVRKMPGGFLLVRTMYVFYWLEHFKQFYPFIFEKVSNLSNGKHSP